MGGEWVFGGGILLLLLVYFLPTVIACARGHQNTGSILVVNLFLGWTLIGYVVALAWSFAAKREPIPVKVDMAIEKTKPSSIERECPTCGEFIKKAAVKCRFCGTDLSPPSTMTARS